MQSYRINKGKHNTCEYACIRLSHRHDRNPVVSFIVRWITKTHSYCMYIYVRMSIHCTFITRRRQRLAKDEVWNFFKLAKSTLKHQTKHPQSPDQGCRLPHASTPVVCWNGIRHIWPPFSLAKLVCSYFAKVQPCGPDFTHQNQTWVNSHHLLLSPFLRLTSMFGSIVLLSRSWSSVNAPTISFHM